MQNTEAWLLELNSCLKYSLGHVAKLFKFRAFFVCLHFFSVFFKKGSAWSDLWIRLAMITSHLCTKYPVSHENHPVPLPPLFHLFWLELKSSFYNLGCRETVLPLRQMNLWTMGRGNLMVTFPIFACTLYHSVHLSLIHIYISHSYSKYT